MHCAGKRKGERPSWLKNIEHAMKKQVKESDFIPSPQSGISAYKHRMSKTDSTLYDYQRGIYEPNYCTSVRCAR